MRDEPSTSYLIDLHLGVISHAEIERATGSCADCPADEALHLQIADDLGSWVLFGGRAAAREFAEQILELVSDDTAW